MPSKLTTFILLLAITLMALISPAISGTKPEAMKWFRRGFELAMEKKYEEALEAYRKGKRIDPSLDKTAPFTSKRAGSIYNQAYSIKGTDKEEAASLFLMAGEMEKTNPAPYNQLGMIEASRVQYDKAELYFYKALNIRPDYVLTIGNLGVLFAKIKNHRKAYFWNRLNLVLDPNSPVKDAIEKDVLTSQEALGLDW